MDEFVAGNWQASKQMFEQALSICPRDKPSQRILMHMDTPDNHPDCARLYDQSPVPTLHLAPSGPLALLPQPIAFVPHLGGRISAAHCFLTPGRRSLVARADGLATTPFVAPEGWPGYHILLSK